MFVDSVATDSETLCETVVFLNYFKNMSDPRQRGEILYPLVEILLLTLLAVLAGADSFVDIARFGDKKLDLLRRFRPFADGTPSHHDQTHGVQSASEGRPAGTQSGCAVRPPAGMISLFHPIRQGGAPFSLTDEQAAGSGSAIGFGIRASDG